MKMKIILAIFLFILSTCPYAQDITSKATPRKNIATEKHGSIKTIYLNLFDEARHRAIPIVIYHNKQLILTKVNNFLLPMVIINHGYGMPYTEYSFIANNLVSQGYFVVSIQHDLKDDPPLPRWGVLRSPSKVPDHKIRNH